MLIRNGQANAIVSCAEALKIAEDSGLDLVQVGGNQTRAVCKVIDYSKFIYEQHKKEKKNNSKNRQALKEIRIGDSTAENDLKIKAKAISRILKEGDKVKATITYKGRLISFISRGLDRLNALEKIVEQDHVIDQKPKFEGNKVYMILSPKK